MRLIVESSDVFEATLHQVGALPAPEVRRGLAAWFARATVWLCRNGGLGGLQVRSAEVHVQFAGEAGVDGGGLSRALFSTWGRDLVKAAADGPGGASATRLFKVTDAQGLAPTSAENLTGREGRADDSGPVVPECEPAVLARYRACGRVSGLALINNCPLGCRFARYFVRLLRGSPPTEIHDMRASQSCARSLF